MSETKGREERARGQGERREHEGKARGESWELGKGGRGVESLAKGCTQFYECWRGISEAMFGSCV